jgi:hypothetical protein
MQTDEFEALLRNKQRRLVVTKHASKRAKERLMLEASFYDDILHGKPAATSELESEEKGERKFMVYYHQAGTFYHVYVIVMDGTLRLLTVYRANKVRQKALSKGGVK